MYSNMSRRLFCLAVYHTVRLQFRAIPEVILAGQLSWRGRRGSWKKAWSVADCVSATRVPAAVGHQQESLFGSGFLRINLKHMQHLPEELIVLVLRAIDEVVDIAHCAAVSKVWRQGGEQSCPSLLLIPARSVEADMPTYNAGAAKAFPTKLVLIADDDRFDDSVQELRWLQQHWVYSANCRSAYVGFIETGHVMAAAFLSSA